MPIPEPGGCPGVFAADGNGGRRSGGGGCRSAAAEGAAPAEAGAVAAEGGYAAEAGQVAAPGGVPSCPEPIRGEPHLSAAPGEGPCAAEGAVRGRKCSRRPGCSQGPGACPLGGGSLSAAIGTGASQRRRGKSRRPWDYPRRSGVPVAAAEGAAPAGRDGLRRPGPVRAGRKYSRRRRGQVAPAGGAFVPPGSLFAPPAGTLTARGQSAPPGAAHGGPEACPRRPGLPTEARKPALATRRHTAAAASSALRKGRPVRPGEGVRSRKYSRRPPTRGGR